DSASGRLFEKVVEASSRGLLRGAVMRFGWPIEPGWPLAINDRIQLLGSGLGLELETLRGKTKKTDKDRGLDVAGRISFGDEGAGTIVLLTQCAAGKHWRKKTGQPALQRWQHLIQWNAHLLRAVAIPWRL